MNKINTVKISVIIPTYDNDKYLLQAIESLKEQSLSGYEILVVDNACCDTTRILVKKSIKDISGSDFYIEYICEPNIGLHNARHAGARAARGDILLYIDDDIVADKNLLEEIFNSYIDEDIGCVGGKILPKWEITPPQWIEMFPKWYLSILDNGKEKEEIQWIYGCNFSIKKELLLKLGGFNPDAFSDEKMWWMRGDGEAGLLMKVHKTGKKVIFNPGAITWHFIPKERLSIDYFKERAFKHGIEASFTKYHYGDGSFNIFTLVMRSSIFALYYFFKSILELIPGRCSIKHKVSKFYYKARHLYELKLAKDKQLQEFVKRESWLK